MKPNEEELKRLKEAMPNGYTVDRRGKGRIGRALLTPVGERGGLTSEMLITAIRRRAVVQTVLSKRVDSELRVRHASLHFDLLGRMVSKKEWRTVDGCRDPEHAKLLKQWRDESMSEYEGKSTVGATPEVEAAQAAANEAEAAAAEETKEETGESATASDQAAPEGTSEEQAAETPNETGEAAAAVESGAPVAEAAPAEPAAEG